MERIDVVGSSSGQVKGVTPKLSSDFRLRLNCPAVYVALGDTVTVVFSQLGEICC